MKRPDTFICVDNENSENLSKFLSIPNIVNCNKDKIFDVYWDDVICQMRDFVWWNEKKPTDKKERFVWENRAAFFDSLFYRKWLAHQLPIQGDAGSPPGLPAEENVVESIFLYVLVVPDEKERSKHDAELGKKKDAEHPDHKPNFVFVHNWT